MREAEIERDCGSPRRKREWPMAQSDLSSALGAVIALAIQAGVPKSLIAEKLRRYAEVLDPARTGGQHPQPGPLPSSSVR